MTTATHNLRESPASLRRESAFVYARIKGAAPEEELFYLPDGQAEEMRSFTRERLCCPILGCPSPELTTVRRRHLGRRDGFAHLSKVQGEHAPESIQHERAKVAVAQSVMHQHPEVIVELERSTMTSARRADVMLTWPNGRQVAVEIQYSDLSILDWQQRHDSYRSQGIIDVWLFGHQRLRQDATGGDWFSIPELEQTVFATRTTQVGWINVERNKVAVAYRDGRLPRPGERVRIWAPSVVALSWSAEGMMVEHWNRLIERLELQEIREAEEAMQARALREADEQEYAQQRARIKLNNDALESRVARALAVKVEKDYLSLGIDTKLVERAKRYLGELLAEQISNLTKSGLDFEDWLCGQVNKMRGQRVDILKITSALRKRRIQVASPVVVQQCAYETLKPMMQDGSVVLTEESLEALLPPLPTPWLSPQHREHSRSLEIPRNLEPTGTQRRTHRDCVVCGLPLDDAIRIDRHPVDHCDRP